MPGSVPAAVELTAVQLAGHVVGRRRAVPRLIAVPAVEAAPRIGSVIAVAVRHTAAPPGRVKAGAASSRSPADAAPAFTRPAGAAVCRTATPITAPIRRAATPAGPGRSRGTARLR